MSITAIHIVCVCLFRIGRLLMCMTWPSCIGSIYLFRKCRTHCLGVGRPVPFVSDWPGIYGRLLLAVYVRWQTGLLVTSDWLRPVTRGGWRAGLLEPVSGSVDVS